MLQLLEFRRQMFLEWQQQTQASLSSSIWLSELPELHLLFTAVDLILYGESANRIRRLANDVNRFRDNAEISDTPASRMLVVDETELRNIETRCIFSDAYVAQYVERADLPDTALTNETYVRRVLTDLCVSMSVMDSEAEFFSRCVFAGISSETHFLTSREAGIVAIAQKAARTPGKVRHREKISQFFN